MQPVNLIPAYRLNRRRRACRVSRWTKFCVLYAAVVLLGCFTSLAGWQRSSLADLEEEIRTTNEQIESTRQNVSRLKEQLTEAQRDLEAVKAVGPQPDWSVLLSALAAQTGENIVLESCSLTPVLPEEAAGAEREDPQAVAGFILKVSGFGRTQRDVSDFVLRLEEMVLLDTVSLVNSRREPFLADYAVVFEVRCSIDGSGGSPR